MCVCWSLKCCVIEFLFSLQLLRSLSLSLSLRFFKTNLWNQSPNDQPHTHRQTEMNNQALNSLTLMKKNVQCPVCLDTMTNPHSLRCQHTFCKECIVRALRHSSSCPQCRLPARPREMRHNPQIDQIATNLKLFLSASGIGSPSYPNRVTFVVNNEQQQQQQQQQVEEEPEDPSSCTFYDVDEDMLRLEITSKGVLNLVVNDKTTTKLPKLLVHEKNGILNDFSDEPIVVKHADIQRVMLWLRVEAKRRAKKCKLEFENVEEVEEKEEVVVLATQDSVTQLSDSQPPSPPAVRMPKMKKNPKKRSTSRKSSSPQRHQSGRNGVGSKRKRRHLNLLSNSDLNSRTSTTSSTPQDVKRRRMDAVSDDVQELKDQLGVGWRVEPKWRKTNGTVYYNYYSPNGQKYRSFKSAYRKAESERIKKEKRSKIRVGPGYEVATCDPSFQGVWEGAYEPCIVDALRGNMVSITCVNDRLQIEVHRRFVRKCADYDETKVMMTTTTTKKKKKMVKTIKRKSKRDTTKKIRIVCT